MIDALLKELGESGDVVGQAVAKGSAPGSWKELQSVLDRVRQESAIKGGGDTVKLGVRDGVHGRPRGGTVAPRSQPAGDQVPPFVYFTDDSGVDLVLPGIAVDRFDSDRG